MFCRWWSMLWVMRVEDAVAMFDDDPSRRIPVAYWSFIIRLSRDLHHKLNARAQTRSVIVVDVSQISHRSKVDQIFDTGGSNSNLKFGVYLVATVIHLSNIYISSTITPGLRAMFFSPDARLLFAARADHA
jgi:hypothetical protein